MGGYTLRFVLVNSLLSTAYGGYLMASMLISWHDLDMVLRFARYVHVMWLFVLSIGCCVLEDICWLLFLCSILSNLFWQKGGISRLTLVTSICLLHDLGYVC